MFAAAARSALRSASARLSAIVNPRAAPPRFRISSQKPFSTHIYRSPVEMGSVRRGAFAVNRGTVAHFCTKSKRFQRINRQKIDLKRNTSSVGIVEGVEYDANRNSRIALVRWGADAHRRKPVPIEEYSPPEKVLQSATTTTVLGRFAFSSLPGKETCAKDVFSSAFNLGKTASLPRVPRIAVAGAKNVFFAFGKKEHGKNTFSLSEIEKWKPDSVLWKHRIKRNAAVSWHSLSRQENLQASKLKESKTKKDQGFYTKAKRAPVSYILASHQMQKGVMVMNLSKPSDLS